MANSLVCGLKILFFTLGCVMLATLIYTISVDGLPFRMDLLTPWMCATLIDFYINIAVFGAWVCYKEVKCINAIVWVVLFVCFGSIATCAYIFIQLLKLSPQEASQDPFCHVLLGDSNECAVGGKKMCSPVVATRILFSFLGLLMLATLIYTIVIDGSPFRRELLTPWMTATLVDFYINVVALSVWVGYKETTWLAAFIWIVLLICFGSVTTCIYIVQKMWKLSSEDPVYLVLLRDDNSIFLMLILNTVLYHWTMLTCVLPFVILPNTSLPVHKPFAGEREEQDYIALPNTMKRMFPRFEPGGTCGAALGLNGNGETLNSTSR